MDTANFGRRFFNLAGGSIFYCTSAVLFAYGLILVLGPVLSDAETLTAALPCIYTLWIYEIALLAVLILIVSRKAVDDAVSIVIIMALYMVAGGVALGAVAGSDIDSAVRLASVATMLALLILCAMRVRPAGVLIPFGIWSLTGLFAVVAINYFGPIWMSRMMVGDAAEEVIRRERWFAIQTGILIGIGLVWLEALKSARVPAERMNRPLLQSPTMVYVFALVLLAASSAHMYTMGYVYMYEMSPFLGDYLPLASLASLLILEILLRSGIRSDAANVTAACLPLLALGYAIWHNSTGVMCGWTFDMIAYPPVFCLLTGLAVAIAAWRRRRRPLVGVVFLYALGVVLTFGFAPGRAHSLNVWTCWAVLTAALMAYGIESWRKYYCVAAVALMTFGAAFSQDYLMIAGRFGLTEIGAVMGIAGAGMIGLALLFGRSFERTLRILGSTCLAAFTYDWLGPGFGVRHVAGITAIAILAAVLWYRTRDRAGTAMLTAGTAARIYLSAGLWRNVFLGFAALMAGSIASLRTRRRSRNRAS